MILALISVLHPERSDMNYCFLNMRGTFNLYHEVVKFFGLS